MVQYLLEREADPNGALDDGYKSTALMAGASGNHPEVVPVLVAAGANVDQPDAIGDPALNWAAYMGQVEYAESLLAAGARADIRSVHGNAFEIALRQGWEPLIEMLGAPAEDGLDAVEVVLLDAVSSGDLEATADALQAGASPGLRTGAGIPLLSVAASAANFEVVSRLLEAGADCQESDPIGFTPLFYSARAGSEDTVRILVAAGARIEQVADPGGMGMTALHMAAAHGRVEALQALLELGAGPDAVNIRGESALMWSVTEGHPEAALVLLAAGADPDLEGDSEYSARQAARDYGYDVVLGAMGEPEDGPDA
jgi:ankyrin repeat protein